MDAAVVTNDICSWLKARVLNAGGKGAVFGLSGGIDSAVVGALCKRAFGENVLGVIMPCDSNPQDAEDARLVAEKFQIKTRTIELSMVYKSLLDILDEGNSLAEANLKPRLRMLTLYFHANNLNYLVVGTGNKSELEVGYFTKYGDGGVDLLPLANLVKTHVRDLAYHLDVPERIITKAPSAGLWEAQTDEDEMGLTYDDLDRYLLTGEGAPNIKNRIQLLNQNSRHKRSLPDVPD